MDEEDMRPLEALLKSIKDGNIDMELVDRISASSDARRSHEGRLHGFMFRLSSMSLDDFEGRVSSSDYHVTKDFRQHYQHHMRVMSTIALSAKVYLVKNWELVKDWSELNVVIEDNSGYATEYYNHEPRERKRKEEKERQQKERSIMDDMFDSLDAHLATRHNPVVSVSDVVLDTSDEDFSLTINGHDHLWIANEGVVIIAGYVEEQLKKQNEAPDRITEA